MAAEDKAVLESQQQLVSEFILHQNIAGDLQQARRRKLRVTKIPYKDEAGDDCLLAIGEDLTHAMELNEDLRANADQSELRLARLQKQHELVSALSVTQCHAAGAPFLLLTRDHSSRAPLPLQTLHKMEYFKQRLRMMDKQEDGSADKNTSVKDEVQQKESFARRHTGDAALSDTIGARRWSSQRNLTDEA